MSQILPHTRPEIGCWEWLAYKNPAGYGQVRVDYKLWLAHRYVYTKVVAEIPEGMIVMHKCDNPGCVRPDHLQLGTHLHNVRDKEAKGRGNAAGANGMAKLTSSEMVEVRDLAKSGLFTQQYIGDLYHVNRSCVCRILNGTRGAKAQ